MASDLGRFESLGDEATHPLADVTRRYCYGDDRTLLDNALFQQIVNRE